MLNLPVNKQNGQIYIGLVIAMGLLAILSQVIITLVISSYDLLNYTQARNTAKYIATEHMEIIRNLAYTDVGTVGGIPSGILNQTQTELRNGLNYTIKISVVYIDDTFDNVAPADLLPTDYKRVRVDVSWGGLAASNQAPVTLISDIAPKGVETTTGGGTLSILVFDSNGNPLSGASAHIVATAVNPHIDLTLDTAANGRVILPGAPACSSCYSITVTKTNYSIDRTYTTSEVSNPSRPAQTIIAGKLTETSFAIDKLATLNITSNSNRASNFAPLASQQFELRLNKTIGTDAYDNPVYKYDQTLTTNGSGQLAINNLEWGNYDFIPKNTSYDNAGTNPLTPIILLPNTNQNFAYVSETHSPNSLLTIFTDQSGVQISSVSAQLSSTGVPIATVSSGLSTDPDFGQSFFSNLLAKTYQLVATASGFATYSADIAVAGQKIVPITLSP